VGLERTLADAETRPQWYARDYFGNLYAAGTPKAERPDRSQTGRRSNWLLFVARGTLRLYA
jgi:hypothetical protein